MHHHDDDDCMDEKAWRINQVGCYYADQMDELMMNDETTCYLYKNELCFRLRLLWWNCFLRQCLRHSIRLFRLDLRRLLYLDDYAYLIVNYLLFLYLCLYLKQTT